MPPPPLPSPPYCNKNIDIAAGKGPAPRFYLEGEKVCQAQPVFEITLKFCEMLLCGAPPVVYYVHFCTVSLFPKSCTQRSARIKSRTVTSSHTPNILGSYISQNTLIFSSVHALHSPLPSFFWANNPAHHIACERPTFSC